MSGGNGVDVGVGTITGIVCVFTALSCCVVSDGDFGDVGVGSSLSCCVVSCSNGGNGGGGGGSGGGTTAGVVDELVIVDRSALLFVLFCGEGYSLLCSGTVGTTYVRLQ